MFENWTKEHLESLGYDVVLPSKNQIGYDLKIVRPGRKSIAVQCKYYKKRRVNVAQVEKFKDWMGMFSTKQQFSEGWIISSNGYSQSALNTFERSEDDNNLVSLGTIYNDSIRWDYKNPKFNYEDLIPSSPMEISEIGEKYYIGVFTNKGGTGKTTVAAHLAGAFAIMGKDVILIDIDPQRNLKKLLRNTDDPNDSSLYMGNISSGKVGGTITVLDEKEWEIDKKEWEKVNIVICDCNPTLEKNPDDWMEKFDYCIIPTTLNPLGVAKNGDVIQRTLDKISQQNSHTEKFVLCNQYADNTTAKKRNKLLIDMLKNAINFKDSKTHLIDPNIVAIHRSDALYYWGMHILENAEPELAFSSRGGKSVPREDFLKLAEYFEKRLFN
ncbi:MAG: hypothetical protein TH68_02140 [Candidatus Synechococcus spongiarum 142]|uniref:AAA domain-containing protein n=1 Tax=Candidatus Synechococcus spongiarum 142 TaxID=1608213 RepID=A0A6N3X6B0_9SYNE|nr:MAG: hypothetical protein TH68_02140 [Candidatus Synechococcus spongiarum 142]